MVSRSAATATVNAMPPFAREGEGESVMDMGMFQREQGYRLCLSVLEQLREKGLLTTEEFVQARAVLIEKYEPPISSLSLENP